MASARIFSAVGTVGAAFFFLVPIGKAQLLDDRVWVGGSGNQLWQLDANWNPMPFPNDSGRVDPNPAIITPVVGANISVNLAGNLNVDVGATDVPVASLTIGITYGAVTTNISGTASAREKAATWIGQKSNSVPPKSNPTTFSACSFAQRASGITSVGLKAVAFVNPR